MLLFSVLAVAPQATVYAWLTGADSYSTPTTRDTSVLYVVLREVFSLSLEAQPRAHTRKFLTLNSSSATLIKLITKKQNKTKQFFFNTHVDKKHNNIS